MNIPSHCPECGKEINKTRKICGCGWEIAVYSEEKSVSKQICNYMTTTGYCGMVGTISPSGMNGQYYCSDHWYAALCEKYSA